MKSRGMKYQDFSIFFHSKSKLETFFKSQLILWRNCLIPAVHQVASWTSDASLGKCRTSACLKYFDCCRLIDHCWFFPENIRFSRSAQRTIGDRMELQGIHYSNFVPRPRGRYFSLSSWCPINFPVPYWNSENFAHQHTWDRMSAV